MSDASGAAPDDRAAEPQTAPPAGADGHAGPEESGAAFPAQVRSARAEFEHHVAQARAEFEEANERIKERTGRDLIVAVLIGLGIGAVVLGTLLFVKDLFALFALAAVLLGVFEFSRALVGAGHRVDLVPQLLATAGLVTGAYFLDIRMLWVALFVAIAFVLVWRMFAQMMAKDARTYGDVLGDVVIAGFIQLYVAFMGATCVVLLEQDGGQWWVLSFIVIAVAADTGAYITGITLGRHKMAPRISPNKTWEGFAGAGAAAMIAGVLLATLLLGLPWWAGVVFGLVVLGTATIGDLGESMIKRDLGIKDMSSWLPGHGGVLDRLDSILPSATAALALYILLSPLQAA
ncbi:phosphatidate cytidylyltransferase [Microbacterium thalassium]|uniref:Phosphatidate cytidylyltransferase n=1 Tax=Microbacterium thalassium TaxID=362649 RepID=A0A7X0FR24_9MICO|nr:phosphatidate cytidylyltransferase [Microbacterium thalassium]MBB6392112.1 phosphatidate cytidylyltransferase [Microbacterium thalassium]GLK24929.1 hypothetical protein GCM10017607_22470 [Microbacterium thalassium]